MRIASPTLRIGSGLLLAVLLSVVGYQVFRRSSFYAPEALLQRADDMSWLNNWVDAEPLYRQAEQEFITRHKPSKALYAVSAKCRLVANRPVRSQAKSRCFDRIWGLRKRRTQKPVFAS